MEKNWQVYMLKCADGTYYTGISTDVERRVKEHNEAKVGAKYTKARRPVVLVHTESGFNRSEAAKREALLKKEPRSHKKLLAKD
jgi:putative endonuclease